MAERTRVRILVAEDDREMRRVIVDTFVRDGHEVHGVSDGAALLLELARNSRFHYDAVDLVIADVRMPLCSGLQALETIRTVRSRVPFILLTGFGDREMHGHAERLGAVLLDKPVAMADLKSIVTRTIAGVAQPAPRPSRSSRR